MAIPSSRCDAAGHPSRAATGTLDAVRLSPWGYPPHVSILDANRPITSLDRRPRTIVPDVYSPPRHRISALLLLSLTLPACGDDTTVGAGTDGADGTMGGVDGPTSTGPGSGTDGGSTDGLDESGSDTGGTNPLGPAPDRRLSAGAGTTCRIDDQGTLQCWGANTWGQLGDGTSLSRGQPTVVAEAGPWRSVSTGLSHTCAIDASNGLWCWGENREGQLGNGELQMDSSDPAFELQPSPVAEALDWAQVSAGDSHTCAVTEQGALWCWGNNIDGRVHPEDDTGSLPTPVELPGGPWVDVRAERRATCALDEEGGVWCWGVGAIASGSMQQVPMERPVVALARGLWGDRMCVIDDEAALWCWGAGAGGGLGLGDEEDRDEPELVELGVPVDAVTVGTAITCARSEQTVWCWGRGRWGALADGDIEEHNVPLPTEVMDLGDVVDVAAGGSHVCAVRTDETTVCWGANWTGQLGDARSGHDNPSATPVAVGSNALGPEASGWQSVVLGSAHACGLRDGSAWCWGNFTRGRLGLGSVATVAGETTRCNANPGLCHLTTPRAVIDGDGFERLSLSLVHTCGIRSGQLWCWGDNGEGQLGVDTNGEPLLVPTRVGQADDWTDVAAVGFATCGIRAPGTLWCWGGDTTEQLGQGPGDQSTSSPTQVGSIDDYVQVVGQGHVCARRLDGSLSCWGSNSGGQVGPGGDAAVVDTPTVVPGQWTDVRTGGSATCGIDSEDRVLCWGTNADGVLGTDDQAPVVTSPSVVGSFADWTALALGSDGACGLREDGSLWCWGRSSQGATGQSVADEVLPPTRVGTDDDWIAVTGSQWTRCGLRENGRIECWGANGSGQQGNDTVFRRALPRVVRDDG